MKYLATFILGMVLTVALVVGYDTMRHSECIPHAQTTIQNTTQNTTQKKLNSAVVAVILASESKTVDNDTLMGWNSNIDEARLSHRRVRHFFGHT